MSDSMKLDDLLDLTLREILEQYCTVINLECGFHYGIFKQDDVEKIIEEYNINEYPEGFHVDSLIPSEILDLCEEVKEYGSLVKIVNNLGVSKK